MRLDFNYGMAGRGHNGVNPMWFGRCWGYWLPRTQWNVGRDYAESEARSLADGYRADGLEVEVVGI